MPKITSTITRQQSEAASIPRLPKPIDEMDNNELLAWCENQRSQRMAAASKRRAARDKGKAKRIAEAGQEQKERFQKVEAETFTLDDDSDSE